MILWWRSLRVSSPRFDIDPWIQLVAVKYIEREIPILRLLATSSLTYFLVLRPALLIHAHLGVVHERPSSLITK